LLPRPRTNRATAWRTNPGLRADRTERCEQAQNHQHPDTCGPRRSGPLHLTGTRGPLITLTDGSMQGIVVPTCAARRPLSPRPARLIRGEPSMVSYAFWNNKGGVGKSYLSFVASCEYAHRHPEADVYVIDMCPQANVSETLLGGFATSSTALHGYINRRPRAT